MRCGVSRCLMVQSMENPQRVPIKPKCYFVRDRAQMVFEESNLTALMCVFLESGIQHVEKEIYQIYRYRAGIGSHVGSHRWPTFALSLASANFNVAKKFKLLKLTLSWALTSSHAYSTLQYECEFGSQLVTAEGLTRCLIV